MKEDEVFESPSKQNLEGKPKQKWGPGLQFASYSLMQDHFQPEAQYERSMNSGFGKTRESSGKDGNMALSESTCPGAAGLGCE